MRPFYSDDPAMNSSSAEAAPHDSVALVIGTGALGSALAAQLQSDPLYRRVLLLGRRSEPAIDYAEESRLAQAAHWTQAQCATSGLALRLMVVCTGFLHGPEGQPERSWRQLDSTYLSHSFLVNALGPALLIKHFFPLLPRQGICRVIFLSARVGSIGDNRLGGWYGYRAAKAALNQLVRTASIELSRRNHESVVTALHPGTVDSPLSAPFSKSGLQVRSAEAAAEQIARVIHALTAAQTGQFVDAQGQTVPW
jgi:NAD(P)-dependent dehydrogenase (short-subunit alcohol dehydrogenase family)